MHPLTAASSGLRGERLDFPVRFHQFVATTLDQQGRRNTGALLPCSLFRTLLTAIFLSLPRASLSQPLSRHGQPTLGCHMGTVHWSTLTQASDDHRLIGPGTRPIPNKELFFPKGSCSQDSGRRELVPSFRCGSTQPSTVRCFSFPSPCVLTSRTFNLLLPF